MAKAAVSRINILPFNAVKASTTQGMIYLEKLEKAVLDLDARLSDNECYVGRVGTLALLRISRHWVPEATTATSAAMEPLIKHILS